MTKQKMFNKAVRGLRSQEFKQCLNAHGEPMYNDGNGMHCSWGWVDRSLKPSDSTYYVEGLAADRVGVAPSLDIEQMEFARQLQWCHDDSPTPAAMERRLRRLGEREGLSWPQ